MVKSLSSTNTSQTNLISVRFSKLLAEVGPQEDKNAEGGNLHVNINGNIDKVGKRNQAIGTMTLLVFALPKGITDRKLFAFRIEVTVKGVFEWTGAPPDFKVQSVAYAYLQNLFLMATLEVISLAQKMGFSNLKLPVDFKVSNAKAEKYLKDAQALTKSAVAKKKPKKTREVR